MENSKKIALTGLAVSVSAAALLGFSETAKANSSTCWHGYPCYLGEYPDYIGKRSTNHILSPGA